MKDSLKGGVKGLIKYERCRRCCLSAKDVLKPENFWINDEGLCNICTYEIYQIIPDYRDKLQRHLDELGEYGDVYDEG